MDIHTCAVVRGMVDRDKHRCSGSIATLWYERNHDVGRELTSGVTRITVGECQALCVLGTRLGLSVSDFLG